MGVSCSIAHSTTGRVRLRVPGIKARERFARGLQDYLNDQPGILDVQLNPSCASVIVSYRPEQWTAGKLHDLLQGLSNVDLHHYRPKKGARSNPKVESSEPSGFELVLSSLGMAVSLFAESLAAPLMPILLLGSALPMLSRAFETLTRKDKLNVDVLDASATALLSLQSQFPMALFMVWLVNLGDYIRNATVSHAQAAVKEVLAYRQYPAWVVRNGRKSQVGVEMIQTGETVVVYPGGRIPVDGTVTSGQALIDQQALTGESLPVLKGEGDAVYAATVVQDGKLYVKAERIGDQTEAATVVRLVADAPAQETRIQNYAERWADDLVPYSFLGAGASSLLGGGLHGAASMLIIDYGTGIRIAAPTTVLSSMTKAVRSGILIKGGRYLERLAEIDTIVFDKTGTLTSGHPEITHIYPYNGYSIEDVLSLAAAAEQRLTHPVAKAIVRAAMDKGISIPERTTSHYRIGYGVESMVNGNTVLVGSPRFMAYKNVALPTETQQDVRTIEEEATSPLCVAVDGLIYGVLSYADPMRPEAPEVIKALQDRGIKEIVMLTGDHQGVAKRIAEGLGLSRYVAEVFPREKADIVKRLQKEGRKVAVVGDGINDSPALAYADVGIAVEGGTDVARETANVVLLHGGLWKIPLAVDIGREAVGLIRQNWDLIAVPNTIALAMAFCGLFGPGATTVLSNGSAIVATANALRPVLTKPSRGFDQRSATTIRSKASSAADRRSSSDIRSPIPVTRP